MRALIIRFSSLGDILLQTPFVSWLKLTRPEMEISFLTLKGNEALIEGHPHIDEVLTYDKKKGLGDISNLYNYARKTLAQKKFDLIIDLHGTNRAFLIKTFLPEVHSLSMDKRRIERGLLVKLKIDLLRNAPPAVERNLKDLSLSFGGHYDRKELGLFVQKAYEAKSLGLTSSSVTKTSRRASRPQICICPGASFEAKRWPIENFKALAFEILNTTSWDVRVLGGPEDDFCAVFNELVERFPERIKNLQGKLRLKESMEVVGSSSLCIGNDSVMGHVAESCGTPSFVIFGPTVESFGFRPHLKDSKAFSTEDVWCRPCSTTGSKKCFRKKHYCMLATTVEMVMNSSRELIERTYV